MFGKIRVAVWLVALLLGSLGGGVASAQGLGKFSQWSEPVNLGPVINSRFSQTFSSISRNGLSLYFSSNRPDGFGGPDIWVSQRAGLDAPWGVPQNLGPNINTNSADYTPNLSPDGYWMFFSSDRPGGCGGVDIWLAWRLDPEDDFGWELPGNLGCIMNTPEPDITPAYFEEAETGVVTLYFSSLRPGGLGAFDIYASQLRRDFFFGSAALVWELSNPPGATHPAIRHDGLEMFFASSRPGAFGEADLWVSTRDTARDAWSTPVNLGPLVNTRFYEGGPALSADGTTLYFYSTRPGGFGVFDIYATYRTRVYE